MKKNNIFRKIIISLLVIATVLGGGTAVALGAISLPAETNPFGKIVLVGATDQKAPFFDVVLPEIQANIKENNKHSISPYYDKLPLANNPENFQGLGKSTYANINGETVTAESFYRVKGDALCDPNAGGGLLIYQCIKYKQAHPDEDVEISFTYYRTSASTAVCVLPESKYYGYVRSLFTTNYDEHGFVRISYLLTEAARMGIKVNNVLQLGSYVVKQYNPATGKAKSGQLVSLKKYFNAAVKTDCYDKYAKGKKVSDFMNLAIVEWTINDWGSEMQHVKSAAVSHYLATDGSVHKNATFFTTANLDDIDYKGQNGNGRAQSGVIVSDHEAIYRVTKNYIQRMSDYQKKEQFQEFRKYIYDQNHEQMELILAGKENKIPKDEQIVYLGRDTDPVFELYFTPIGGGIDTWDTVYNPICKYIDKLTQSEDYIELAWNEFAFENRYLGVTISDMIEQAFCGNRNPKNKLSLQVTNLDTTAVSKLKVGKDIGYRSIKNGSAVHSKDFLMSYVEDGVRHNVSIMTSCNYVLVGFTYRTNSILVIHETEKTGGDFYYDIGNKFSGGMIKR